MYAWYSPGDALHAELGIGAVLCAEAVQARLAQLPHDGDILNDQVGDGRFGETVTHDRSLRSFVCMFVCLRGRGN